MGLHVNVLRDRSLGDCTLGGLSSRHEVLVIVNVDGPFDPTLNTPGVRLQSHVKGCVCLVPLEARGKWVMFGGNYAATCDSRLSEAIEKLLGHRFYGAVAIHDRVEA